MLKKITESMKDLVTEANFDCSTTGISLQAMDSSHVSLVALLLRADGFDHFRCDRNISLGINLSSMGKVRTRPFAPSPPPPRAPRARRGVPQLCCARARICARPWPHHAAPRSPQVLKCCNNDDILTLKSDDQTDTMTFVREHQRRPHLRL